jgi:hypothetical protein
MVDFQNTAIERFCLRILDILSSYRHGAACEENHG